MRLAILASGSTGNCTLVSCGGNHLLIDAGISARRITAALREDGQRAGEERRRNEHPRQYRT